MQKTESIWRTLKEKDPEKVKKNGHEYKFVHAPSGWFETVKAPNGEEYDIGFVKTDYCDDDGNYCTGWYGIEMTTGFAVTGQIFKTREGVLDFLTPDNLALISQKMEAPAMHRVMELLKQAIKNERSRTW